jgi:hypothetical protein
LARKLVKEMEDHKVSRGSRVSVRNRFTIFLCEDDFDRLSPGRDDLISKLERHLAKHLRSKRYETTGDVCVDIVLDTDLRLGHFGILAERDAPGFVEQDLPGRPASDAAEAEAWQVPAVVAQGGSGRPASVRDSYGPATGTRPMSRMDRDTARAADGAGLAASGGGLAAGAGAVPAPSAPAAPPRVIKGRPEERDNGGSTRIIAPGDAAQFGLARTTIVIRSGNRVREFTQGRVIIGRAQDADFRIDNPDVSRRHAVIFWSNGQVMLEDLGSTNGTMVNGYPISNTTVAPSDVVVIGDCRMTVDTR